MSGLSIKFVASRGEHVRQKGRTRVASSSHRSVMSDHAHRQSTSAGTQSAVPAVQQSPGKRTLVEQEFAAIQRRGAAPGGPGGDAGVHAAAAQGTATPSSPLPYSDMI